ncbi:hypothetical protein IW140_003377 [Coemansia sp. RSA 1813]|nr:hypothetical protein EV178_003195 [Coemansia sp. RSA 1646]KAJ1771002.1 hypothetical protein LPJ74_002693 [Coemansia sp. RSA 1843]KAJ2089242.1 hypothetical protein IW138_003562 [Coemansia sp. RSA 986]KAJ2215071.1 hypothetical protein EV179_002439 [Coemansia sp. RSA 487]KAJ2569012.1 hypothetical protein IW140_003377 [Coemansia sp. RSA 1813]
MHAQPRSLAPATMSQDASSRIQVDSLLNPPTDNYGATHPPAGPLRKNLSTSTLQQSFFPPLSTSFSFSAHKQASRRDSNSTAAHIPTKAHEFPASNDKECFEMALWKQESGLGPPPHTPSVLGGSRLDCLAALSDPPKVHIDTAATTIRPSAKRMAQPPTSIPLPHAYNDASHGTASSSSNHSTRNCSYGYSNESGTTSEHNNAARWLRKQNYQPRSTTMQRSPGLAEPQIFVPRQPIIGHSAMSIDRSGDFIRPLPTSEIAGPPSSLVYDGFFSHAPTARIPAMAPGQLPPVPMALSSRRSATSPMIQTMPIPMPTLPRMAPPSITLPPMKPPALTSISSTSTSSTSTSSSSSKASELHRLSIPVTYTPSPQPELQSPRKRMRVDSIDENAANSWKEPAAPQTPSSGVQKKDMAVIDSPLPDLSLAQEPQRSNSLNSNSSNVSSAPLCMALPALPALTKDKQLAEDNIARPKARRIPSRRKSSSASSTVSSTTPEKEQPGSKTAETTDGGTAAAGSSREDERPLFDWQKLEVPEGIWSEAQELYDRVKVMKKVQNRQPICKRHAIHAALMFILCRNNGYPRTFAEICAAGNVTKREIGMYYNLMKQVLGKEYTSTMRAKPSEFLQRWCTVLELPSWIAAAATRVYDRADEMAIVQGKCPISISAASLWLVIWSYNHRHSLKSMGFSVPADTQVSSTALPNIPNLRASKHSIDCDQRDVCRAASVVIATLTSVFRLLAPHLQTLIGDVLDVHL